MLSYVKSFGMILGALLMLGTAGTAGAEDWCAKHLRQAERELDKAIDHHGYYSRQAEHERRELERIRDECRYRDYDRYR